MGNEFYTHVGYPQPSAPGRALDASIELRAIEVAFDKGPDITGASGWMVTVNHAASNLKVRQYETGLWTPTLAPSSFGDLDIVYSVRAGHYVIIDHLIFLAFRITTTTFTHTTASGSLFITGIPLFPSAVDSSGTIAPMYMNVTKAGKTSFNALLLANQNIQLVAGDNAGASISPIAIADCPSGTQLDWFCGFVMRTDAL
jgi:hypothetical protein